MSTILTSKQIERLNRLIEFCPEIPANGYIMRSQIKDFVESTGSSWPTFITNQTPLSRGMYPIPGSIIKQSEGEPSIMNEAQPATTSVQNVLPMNNKKTTTQSQVDVNHSIVHEQITSVNALIPEKDPNYIPFGCYSDLDKIISSKIFAPVYITGHSGTGKNVMVEQLCAKHKRPMIRVNMHNQMTEEDLIGSKTLIDGNIQVVEGPLLIAMRTGSVCVLDEFDAMSNGLFLNTVLEGKPYYFRLKNEMIHPKEGFMVIALGNTLGKGDDSGRYIGTNIMNDALLERFALALHQTYPDQKTEKKIVTKLMGSLGLEANYKFINDITKWTSAIRITFEAGGIDETISTRRLTHIIRAYEVFGNINKAVELGCNRFDEMTRAAFEDEVSSPEEVMDSIDLKALNNLIENF